MHHYCCLEINLVLVVLRLYKLRDIYVILAINVRHANMVDWKSEISHSSSATVSNLCESHLDLVKEFRYLLGVV